MSHNIPQLDQGYVGSVLGASKDWRCFCPCRNCKGLRPRKFRIKLARKNCRDYEHAKGRHEYHPFVSYSLYVFVL